MKIIKGDQVKILSGKDRGKTGKVLQVFPGKNKILVEKINLAKKHRKAKNQREKSERISLAMPIDISNAQLICPQCGKSTRVGKKIIDDKNVRVCKKCQAEV